MAFTQWLLRCIPGISIILLAIAIECSLQLLHTAYNACFHPNTPTIKTTTSIGQYIFITYSLLLHVCALAFPIKLCRSVWNATNHIRIAYEQSIDSSLTEIVDENLEEKREVVEVGSSKIINCIIIPSYKESIEILEDTLNVLASHPFAKASYDVFMAMEERDPNGTETAKSLLSMFKHRFLDMQFTTHPAGILGESAGKSSNVSWAAKELERKYIPRHDWKDVLVTVMDSDTHLQEQYFFVVRERQHVNRQQDNMAAMTLYVPPIIFDRNAHNVPTLVRLADLMWCGAGLSCYQSKSSPSGIGIPTAVYSVSLPLVRLVNGWDTGPGAIGEDMHMMLKCYFATNGRLNIESVPSPASQCNITTGVHGVRGWFANINARYNQGLRHMWGCLDTGFAVNQWLNMTRKSSGSGTSSEGSDDGKLNVMKRTRKLSHTELSLRLSQYALHGSEGKRFTFRHTLLFFKLFEAHFLPTHLVMMLISSLIFAASPAYNRASPVVKLGIDISGYLRTGGYLFMVAYLFFFYERYHKTCVEIRESNMRKAGLYEHMQEDFSYRKGFNPTILYEYFIFPVSGTIFGGVPLFQAAISHFWTEHLVYLVSAKPLRAMAQKVEVAVTTTKAIVKEESLDV